MKILVIFKQLNEQEIWTEKVQQKFENLFLDLKIYGVDSIAEGLKILQLIKNIELIIILDNEVITNTKSSSIQSLAKHTQVLKILFTSNFHDLHKLTAKHSIDSLNLLVAELGDKTPVQMFEVLLRQYSRSDKYLGDQVREGDGKNEELIKKRTMNLTRAIDQLQWEIMERKKAEQSLMLAAKVFESTSEAIMITDKDVNIIDVNSSFTFITGYRKEDVLGRNPSLFQSGKHDKDFYRKMWSRLTSLGKWQGEIWDKRKNGEVYPKWLSINEVRDHLGNLSHYVGIFSDITKRKKIEQHLKFLAHYDPLTGLPNRILFHDRLEHGLAYADRHKQRLAVMFLDLDRFKYINDTLGHDAGDRLLKEVAIRLSKCVRKSDTVARLGGDEFTIILSDLQKLEDISHVAQKIIHNISEPISLSGDEVVITTSIGITVYPMDGDDIETLIKNADTAMYHAKSVGKNNFQFYALDMNKLFSENLSLERDLRYALDKNEFQLYYQPIVDLKTEKIAELEALIRWVPWNKDPVLPDKFIPIAEETGLILPIGEWVLEEACRMFKELLDKGFGLKQIAVNISARQFKQENLVSVIGKILDKVQLPPHYLNLEITESTLIHNVESGIRILKELKSMGIRLTMDDFGTGYSSLSYLKKFPLDTIKIDKSFVMDIPQDKDDMAIVHAIISMGESLGITTLAEGIETKEQLDFLKEHHCFLGQGYYFNVPLSGEDLSLLLAKIKETVV